MTIPYVLYVLCKRSYYILVLVTLLSSLFISAGPPPPLPPRTDSLLLVLHPLAPRWEDIAKALGVDEDMIDNIFTINENDQLRLHDLVEHYFQCVHFEHSWREIVQALTAIGETRMAEKITREKLQGMWFVVTNSVCVCM